MSPSKVEGIKAFLPAQDIATSKRFYLRTSEERPGLAFSLRD
jgi:hypothetical protein